MNEQERIEKEAYAVDRNKTSWYAGYIAGANAERERLSKEIEKLKSEIAALQSGVE